MLMDWAPHHVDIAHWGLGMTNPGRGSGRHGRVFEPEPRVERASKFRVVARYANGVVMTITGGYDGVPRGARWTVTMAGCGWIAADCGATAVGAEQRDPTGRNPAGTFAGAFPQFSGVRGHAPPPHRAAGGGAAVGNTGVLGLVSILTKSKIKWDPVEQKILDHPVAERLLGRTMRSPWHI